MPINITLMSTYSESSISNVGINSEESEEENFAQ